MSKKLEFALFDLLGLLSPPPPPPARPGHAHATLQPLGPQGLKALKALRPGSSRASRLGSLRACRTCRLEGGQGEGGESHESGPRISTEKRFDVGSVFVKHFYVVNFDPTSKRLWANVATSGKKMHRIASNFDHFSSRRNVFWPD